MRYWLALLATVSVCLNARALGEPVEERDLAARCRSDLSALARRTDLPRDAAVEARAAAARLPALPPQFDDAVDAASIGGGAQPVHTPEEGAASPGPDPRAELAAALQRCRPILRKGPIF